MSRGVDRETSVMVSDVSGVESDCFDYGQVPLAHVEESIRLLDLEPGVGGDQIVCSMRTGSLSKPDHGKSYEALSYCWGSEEKSYTVTCNRMRAKVTASLFNALRSLRLADKMRTLWVDALCINQTNLDEKAQQVTIMARVYQAASRTVIYIGERTESSQLAFDTIERLYTASQVMPNPEKFVNITELFRDCLGMVDLLAEILGTPYSLSRMTLFPQPRCTAVVSLLRRPWFERVWVIQELLCARERYIMCGSDGIIWERFVDALHYGATINIFDGANSFGPRQSFNWLLGAASMDNVQDMSLLQNLRFFHSWKASNPVDKIYAMHGIAHLDNGRFSELGSQLVRMDISPDYSANPSELYQKVAYNICHHERNLDVLSYVASFSFSMKGLPSWAPNWSQGHPRLMPFRPILDSGNDFQASLATLSTPNVQDSVLTLQGYVFDTLDVVGMPDRDFVYSAEALELDQDNFLLHQTWNAWTTATSLDDYVERMGNKFDFSFWSLAFQSALKPTSWLLTLQENLAKARRAIDWESIAIHNTTCRAAGREANLAIYLQTLNLLVEPLPASLQRVAFEGYGEEMRWGWIYRPFARLGFTNAAFLFPFFPLFIAVALAIRYVRPSRTGTNYFSDSPFTSGRRLARTVRGRLGLVPEAAEGGDSIALLKGGKVPLILREEDAHRWRIVGEAYVNGVMQGEAFKEDLCGEMMFV